MTKARRKSKRTLDRLKKKFNDSPDEADALSLARDYKKAERPADAENFLQSAIEQLSESIELPMVLANLYMESGKIQQAFDLCNEILEKNPDKEDVLKIMKKIALIQQQSEESMETDDEGSAPFQEAVEFLKNGEFEQALNVFKSILDEDAENEEAILGFKAAYAGLVASEADEHDVSEKLASKNQVIIQKTIDILEYWLKVVKKRRLS